MKKQGPQSSSMSVKCKHSQETSFTGPSGCLKSILFTQSSSSSSSSSSSQSIADLNRSSNGSSSKRLSLDSSHLDSSRDTDSGTPFSSPTPTCKPPAKTDIDGG